MSNEAPNLEQRLLSLLHGFMEEHGLEPEEGAENWCAELDEAFVKRLAEFVVRERQQARVELALAFAEDEAIREDEIRFPSEEGA